MRKLALVLMALGVPLFAEFFPSTLYTSIASVGEKSVQLSTPLPRDGMSGVVIHAYGNDLEAIVGRVVQHKDGTVTLHKASEVHHDNLPTVNTTISEDDEVVGGYLYNNVLLIAPDASTYTKITRSYDKHWVHPDLLALFLSKEKEPLPTKANLAKFANAYQVGLVCIVKKEKMVLLDPISGAHVAQKSLSTPTKGKYPFFMRLDGIETGWFSGSGTEGDYYKAVEAL